MSRRHTIRGLIIKDKKILLVTGHNAGFYWTPGGGVEDGETVQEALHREIKEELGLTVVRAVPYSTFTTDHQLIENFLIEVEGEITPGAEITGFAWYDTTSSITLSESLKVTTMPLLIEQKLVN